MDHCSLSWRTPHKDAYGFTPVVAHLKEFKWWETILILDEKTHFTDSHNIFGYYAGPDPNRGAIDCSWVWTEENGLIARSVLHNANIPTDPNYRMVPVSREIKEESYILQPVNFVSANWAKDGTDITLPTIIYKDAIVTIQQVKKIIDHIIVTGKNLLLPHGKYG